MRGAARKRDRPTEQQREVVRETEAAKQTGALTPERTLLGLAASSALIVAACLSGLPSTSCAALAQTCGMAIDWFGVVAVVSLIMAGLLPALGRVRALFGVDWRSHSQLVVDWPVAILVVFSFLVCAGTSMSNLRISTKHCLIGTETEIPSRLHEQIPLYSIWRMEQWTHPVPVDWTK
jgi:hypothetical protein